jgi:polyhydroxyalkanoate depolymerase
VAGDLKPRDDDQTPCLGSRTTARRPWRFDRRPHGAAHSAQPVARECARRRFPRAGNASILVESLSKTEPDGQFSTDRIADGVIVLEKPFCRLRHIAPQARICGPPLLIVSPLSAHRVRLLHDVIVALSPHLDIYVIEWRNVRDVPVADGPFGLDENIAYIVAMLRALGPDTHVLALSQSPIPALAAAALMAEAEDPAQPRSLTLISGFIDPRINPRRFDLLVGSTPMSVFSRTVTDRVPAGFGGEGRYIYPARVQRGALLTTSRGTLRSAASFTPSFSSMTASTQSATHFWCRIWT